MRISRYSTIIGKQNKPTVTYDSFFFVFAIQSKPSLKRQTKFASKLIFSTTYLLQVFHVAVVVIVVVVVFEQEVTSFAAVLLKYR